MPVGLLAGTDGRAGATRECGAGVRRGDGRLGLGEGAGRPLGTDSGCLEEGEALAPARVGGFGAGGRRGEVGKLAGHPEVAHVHEAGEHAVDLAHDEGADEGEDEAGEEFLGEGEAERERESGRLLTGGCDGVRGLLLDE